MTSDLPPTGGSQPPEPSSAGPVDPAVPAAPVGPASESSSASSDSSASSGPSASGPSSSGHGPYGHGPSGHGPSGHGSFGHSSTGPGSFGHASDDFFNRIRSTGVVRPEEGRWAAGVAAGLARRWDVDPILVRGLFVATSLLGAVGVLLYGLAWLLLPQDDGRIHVQQAIRGDISSGFIGGVIVTLLGLGGGRGPGPWHDGFWFFPGGLLFAVLAVAGIFWLAKRNPTGETPGWSASPPTGETGTPTGPAPAT